MHIEKGEFDINGIEKIMIEGEYYIQSINNKLYNPDVYLDLEENIPCQSVYSTGNVICRSNTENLKELIDVFIRYTHNPCDDLELDKTLASSKVIIGGTICPTRKLLFSYKSKVFVAFGRYIFGYDEDYVIMNRVSEIICQEDDDDNDEEEDDDDDDDEWEDCNDEEEYCREGRRQSSKPKQVDQITNDKIVLVVPKYTKNCDDYIYSFMIYDKNSNILDAFGLYR